MRAAHLALGIILTCFALGFDQLASATEPTDVFVPDEAWADEQSTKAFEAIPNRNLEMASSLFDDGWSPFFGFPPIAIFNDQVAAFDWSSGSWRRSSLQSYLAGSPNWETMFSLSSVPSSDRPFSPRPWSNLACQSGFSGRCLIAVTQGGFDKVRWIEIDASTGEIPEEAFDLPSARSSVAWVDRDTILVAIGLDETDTGATGYPLTVRIVRRGDNIATSPVIYRAGDGVGFVSVYSIGSAGNGYAIISATEGTRNVDTQFVDRSGALQPSRIPVAADALGILGKHALFSLLEDWEHATDAEQEILKAGSVVAIDLTDVSSPELVMAASQEIWASGLTSNAAALFTKEAAYISTLEGGVRSVLRASRTEEGWGLERVLGDGKAIVSLVSADAAGDAVLASSETALSAPVLFELRGSSVVGEVRQSRSFFASDGLEIERFSAIAKDGTPIPYWRIGSPIKPDASAPPTILHAYGASNVPLLPEYAGDVGRMWLEAGGTYVYAQIRGGGEYGANWYNSGHGENRAVPLQDFVAVARDLVARGLASPESLGADGTSDGGRLVSGAALLRPDLFAAVVSRDGSVYPEASNSQGSPILAQDLAKLETPEGRALARAYWPDRLLDPARGCAPTLFTTWRGDQRVSAQESRALVEKMQKAGCDALLVERLGGDHGTIDAELIALIYGFFGQRLGL